MATGSHTDAIPFSGKYDGVVGVLGALEAISVLKRSNFYCYLIANFRIRAETHLIQLLPSKPTCLIHLI